MRKPMKILAVISTIIAGLALAPALYAQDLLGSRGSMMGPGMMGQGGMMNMTGQMGQMGQMAPMGKMRQMGTMDQMSQMMEHCNQMMQGATGGDGSGKPNEQWRKDAPAAPEKNG